MLSRITRGRQRRGSWFLHFHCTPTRAAISRAVPWFLSLSPQMSLVDGDVDVAPIIGRDQVLSIEDHASHVGLKNERSGRLIEGEPGHVIDQLLLSVVVGLITSRAIGHTI